MNINKILFVTDMQNDFVSGVLGSEDAKSIVPNVVNKIKEYKSDKNALIVFTKDTHLLRGYENTCEDMSGIPAHCIFKTDGWNLIPEVRDLIEYDNSKRCLFIEKSSFTGREVDDSIYYKLSHMGMIPSRVIESIEIVGLCTDICVISNALLLRSEYPYSRVVCNARCCAGTSKEKHKAALEVMKSCCIEVINEE